MLLIRDKLLKSLSFISYHCSIFSGAAPIRRGCVYNRYLNIVQKKYKKNNFAQIDKKHTTIYEIIQNKTTLQHSTQLVKTLQIFTKH